jgi:hypothetical protein
MNPLTLQGIAQALWMKDYDPARIPPEILKRIESAPNSERSYAERFLARLDQLEANSISFVPSFKERYALLRSYLKAGGFSDAVAGLRADLAENPLTKGVVSSDQARRGYKAAIDAALGRGSQALTEWIEGFR